MLKRNNEPFTLSAEEKKKYSKATIYINRDVDWIKENFISGKSTEIPSFRGRDILIPCATKHVFDDGILGQLEYYERIEFLNGNVNLPMHRPTHIEGLIGQAFFKIEGNADLNYYLQKTYLCENGELSEEKRKILRDNGDASAALFKIYESSEIAETLNKEQKLMIETMAAIQNLNDQQTEVLLSRMKADGGFNLGRIRDDMTGIQKRTEINNLVQANAKAFEHLLVDLTGEGKTVIKEALAKAKLVVDKNNWVLVTADGKETLAKAKDGNEAEAVKLITGEKLEKVKAAL